MREVWLTSFSKELNKNESIASLSVYPRESNNCAMGYERLYEAAICQIAMRVTLRQFPKILCPSHCGHANPKLMYLFFYRQVLKITKIAEK